MGLGKPPTTRELIYCLRKIGAKALRQTGSHQVWLLPNGKKVPLVVNHAGEPCSRRVLATVADALGFVPCY